MTINLKGIGLWRVNNPMFEAGADRSLERLVLGLFRKAQPPNAGRNQHKRKASNPEIANL
jgi:hypothetical protein